MAIAPFTKYFAFIDELSKGGHNLTTAAFKLALTNAAPSANAHLTFNPTDVPAPAAVAGYSSGGNALTTASASMTTGVFKLVLNDTVFTASGGSIGPFRYSVLYNTSAGNKLVGFYDYGGNITLGDTETFTFDADATLGVLTLG